jgi:hypothetical protein
MSLARRCAAFVVSRVLPAALACGLLVGAGADNAQGQTLLPGRNVNMVSGTQWPNGDPYLQRQNEPSIAASTRNPLHLLAGANDYRTVDVPFVTGAGETGDAWLGLFMSFDGGQRWQSTLVPGYPQDTSAEGMASPLFGYQAGADPVVRAGTNGLFYYAGLVFDRVEGGKNAIVVSRFIDNNNQEASFREAGFESRNNPVKYLGASIVAQSDGDIFYDKPWMAVDIPRPGARVCTIETNDGSGATRQRIQAGRVYVAYTAFTEDAQGPKSQIYLTRSEDCGRTWLPAMRISNAADRLNQGATIAVDPRSGTVYVAWRRFSSTTADTGDGFLVVKSTDLGRRFSTPGLARALAGGKGKKVGLDYERYFEHRIRKRAKGGSAASNGKGKSGAAGAPQSGASDIGVETNEFDQGTSTQLLAFRTNMYPTMAVDGSGRIYLAWSERGYGEVRDSDTDGDARIVMATSADGRTWTTPAPVANEGQPGHQLMPSLTFGGGKLVLVYYDLRDDISQTYAPWIDDKSAFDAAPLGARRRRTLDLRASYGTPGAAPAFDPSIRVSDYLFSFAENGRTRQLQYNAPNLPMFAQGTAPFMGDYVDVTVAPVFVPTAAGGWAYNLNGPKPVFHAVWTDNRDVRAPLHDANGDGNPWNDYKAPTALTQRTQSRFDPSQMLPACDPNDGLNTGSRNQNIYTARLTTGLVAGSPGNSKPLSSTLQRAFVVFAQNTTNVTKAFRLTILNQPPGGRASFDQFNPATTTIDVTTPYRTTASRTVYVTSSDPAAMVHVSVVEIPAAGAAGVTEGGLSDVVILNPDIANPDIANPDIANPDIANPDIANAEVYNPDIANPDIANPDIANPDIANPDIANPDIANPDIANPDIANPDIANPDIANADITNVEVANPDIANPDIANPDIANPDIANPDIANPDIANPDIANPDITNASLTDVTWTMTNNGNTTAAFNVNLFLAQQTDKLCQSGQNPDVAGCIAAQLILRKVYATPTAVDCRLQVETRNVVLANIRNPRFVTPGTGVTEQNDPSAENATLWLAPGETAKITLRVYDPNKYDNVAPIDDRPETATDPDRYVIDPLFLPTTTTSLGSVTPVVQQQSVDTADVLAVPPGGTPPQPPLVTPLTESVPPAQTPTPLALSFLAQPSAVIAGVPMSPAVQVEVRDQYGALLPNWSVTLFLATNPANASLGGAVATTDAMGVATFPGVTVTSAGIGFTLAATSGTALPIVSAAFDVMSACDPLVVTTTADTNVCGTLRYAINAANVAGGTVTFEIAEPVPHVIIPATHLPAVTSGVVIDATTDPHWALGGGQPVVQISGANLSSDRVGLNLTGTGSAIRGIEFNGFVAGPFHTSAAVVLGGGGNHTVTSSHFGMIVPNYTGIHVTSSSNVIGGTAVGDGNTVGGAGQDQGIWIQSGANNRIEGNLVGNNGVTAFGNGVGIRISGGTATIVGGAASGARNVISGNTVGVLLVGGTATEIRGNYVGLNAAGTGAIPNNEGITAYNVVQNTVIQANWIAGNSQWGIDLQRSGALPAVANTQILSNTIGLNTAGAALANGGGGVRLTGTEGTVLGAPGAGNTISGNNGPGVVVNLPLSAPVIVSRPVIRANYIGTDQAGTLARRNRFEGIVLRAAATVGGTAAGDGNLISGNGVAPLSGTGVLVLPGSNGSAIQGNIIGLGVTGAPLGNGYSGITVYDAAANVTIGGTVAGARNVISGNPSSGIAIYPGGTTAPSSITIQGNHIGTDVAGTGPAGNGAWGVAIDGTSIVVGGLGAGEGNLIAHNAAGGVQVASATAGVSILSNSILSNGGLGIDVNPAGVSGLAPVLSNATVSHVSFSPAAAGTYTYQFFANATCDISGFGEGQALLGSTSASAGGTASFATAAPVGWFVTATATDAGGNTTEFSGCTVVSATGTPVTVVLGNFSAVYDGSAKAVTVATAPVAGLSVDVTYAGSPTEPTAIGAYAVVATVTEPGYTGSASATLKIASTLAAGGGGGGPYERYCGPGVFANGFRAAVTGSPNEAFGGINYALTSGQLLCGDGNHPAKFGGGTTPNSDMTCPVGEVMVGMFGTTGGPGYDVVTSIGPRCQLPTGGAVTQVGPAPGGGTPFEIDCPAGQAVVAVVGGQGAVVDSIALVCSAIPPPGPAITSVLPSTVAAFQYITLEGVSLPASGQNDVLFSQGGPEFASDYIWSAGSTRVIARVPTGVLAVGAATVRLKNPAGTITTNAVPITIDSVPGAPVLHAVYNSCSGGSATTTLNAGQQFMIEAAGTGSAGTEFSWTDGVLTIPGSSSSTSGGPTGRVGTCATLPGGVTAGSWTLSIRSYTGAWSTGTTITIQ